MELHEEQLAGVPLVTVVGDIDHATCDEFEAAVERALSQQDRRIFLDLADCGYMDSGGLAVLLGLVRWAAEEGWVAVIGPNRNVNRLFEIVGLDRDPRFRVFSSRKDAGEAVQIEA